MSPKILRQYDSFQDRVQTICEAMQVSDPYDYHVKANRPLEQTQKTLCKHLLRQPFNEEVVEDPIAAVSVGSQTKSMNNVLFL